MSFLDQMPRVATEDDVKGSWDAAPNGKRFRCHLCGHRFKVGDIWRWVYAGKVNLTNFLVCEACDGPDVLERWQAHYKDGKTRFWWMAD